MPISEVHNVDCIQFMKQFPDKHFDLAIVDPPYGLNFGSFNRTNKSKSGQSVKANKYHNANWDDSIPTDEYFEELFRVSNFAIIWGGNYFPLPPTKCFVFWYKHQPVSNFADGELAWTNFNKPALCFDYPYFGNTEGGSKASEKIHPTQKPIALYEWLLANFAKPGFKILDTHLGSGSSRIAAHKLGFDFFACEIDPVYCSASEDRFQEYISMQPKNEKGFF